MARIGRRSSKPPLPTRIDLWRLGPDKAEDRRLEPDEPVPPPPAKGVAWLNVEGLGRVERVQAVAQAYGLHALVVQDALNVEQRPKTEDFGSYLFIALKMLSTDPESGEVCAEHVSLVLGKGFVLTFQEGVRGDPFDRVRRRLKEPSDPVGLRGADHLAYFLLDAVVDHGFGALEELAGRMDSLEPELMRRTTTRTLARIHRLRRELVRLRGLVWPLREAAAALERSGSAVIQEATRPYLRDLHDRAVQLNDSLETLREVLSAMAELHLASVSHRMNEEVKALTGMATVFIPLTFIAGVYGMNFRHMPELEWRWGYAGALGLMAAVALGLFLYFRRRRLL